MPVSKVAPNEQIQLQDPGSSTTSPPAGSTVPDAGTVSSSPYDPKQGTKYSVTKVMPNEKIQIDQPRDAQTDPDPNLNPGAWAGTLTRAVAPVTAAAGTGAAIGATLGTLGLPGPGTAAGAGFGAAAGGLAEIALSGWNIIAEHTGLPKVWTPEEATDKLLDYFGMPRAQTSLQRITQALVSAGVTGGGTAQGIKTAESAIPASAPVFKRIMASLGEHAGRQAAASAAGGGASQFATEMGAPPWLSTAIGMGAGLLEPWARRVFVPGRPSPEAVEAYQNGYVLHPGNISHEPGAPAQFASGSGGKFKSFFLFRQKNQENTNRLARAELGLAPDTPLNDDSVFDRLRDRAAQAYRDIGQAVPFIFTKRENPASLAARQQNTVVSPLTPQVPVPLEAQFAADIDAIGNVTSTGADLTAEMQKTFPTTTRVPPKVRAIQNELRNIPSSFSPEAGLEYVKIHRARAQELFREKGGPENLMLARAELRAAAAIENLMDRQLANINHPDLVARYQAARQLIAKSYAVQTSVVGADVDARRIASLDAMNRSGTRRSQLTGNLKVIANAYNNFRNEMMLNRQPNEEMSVLDLFGAASIAAHGHPIGALLFGGRPTMRHLVASPLGQGYQVRGGQVLGVPPSGRGTGQYWRSMGIPMATVMGLNEEQGQGGSLYPYYNEDQQ